MKVAIAWPNMWLSGSRFRKRIGRNGARPLLVLRHLALDRDDVRQDVAVGDDDAFGLGRRAGREDDFAPCPPSRTSRCVGLEPAGVALPACSRS